MSKSGESTISLLEKIDVLLDTEVCIYSQEELEQIHRLLVLMGLKAFVGIVEKKKTIGGTGIEKKFI